MITVGIIRELLGWCCIINIGLLLWWFLIILLAHNWIYRIHRKWFKISEETFDTIHYTGIALFKIAIFVFNIVPYIALRIIGQ